MITEIGITAGEIWHYLDGHGKSTLQQIMKAIDVDRDQLLMSIGWLAREGHIVLEKSGPDRCVYLRR